MSDIHIKHILQLVKGASKVLSFIGRCYCALRYIVVLVLEIDFELCIVTPLWRNVFWYHQYAKGFTAEAQSTPSLRI